MSMRGISLALGLASWLLCCPSSYAQDYPSSGLGTYIHPLNVPYASLDEQSQAIPEAQRDQVHFFVINGFDPLYVANLNGMAEYIQSLGFRNTRLFLLAQSSAAGDEIRAVRQQAPSARIILMGYSWGTNAARSIANQLSNENIYIDSLIYLGGDTIMNVPQSRPGNVGNVLNITGNGLIFLGGNLYYKGDNIGGADNRRLAVRHMLLPSRREAIEWISQEVIRVAQETPVSAQPTKAAPAEPTPPSIPAKDPTVPTPTEPTQPKLPLEPASRVPADQAPTAPAKAPATEQAPTVEPYNPEPAADPASPVSPQVSPPSCKASPVPTSTAVATNPNKLATSPSDTNVRILPVRFVAPAASNSWQVEYTNCLSFTID
jgi:pimeloyl-ACP methyl ester carboxylesterase